MAFSDALAAQAVIIKGPPCSVQMALDNMDDSDVADLIAALEDPAWLHSQIAQALRDEGYDIGNDAVSRHRRGLCKCEARRGVR